MTLTATCARCRALAPVRGLSVSPEHNRRLPGPLFGAVMLALVLIGSCTGNEESAPVQPSVAAATPLVDGVDLAAGDYVLDLPAMSVTFTVPAGWSSWPYGVVPTDAGEDPRGGVGLGFWVVGEVNPDPCNWGRGASESPLRPVSVEGLAATLKAQTTDGKKRPSTPAADVTLDGYSGLELEVEVPRDLDLSSCTQSKYISWYAEPTGGRTQQGPGQIDHLWILDVDGGRLVVDAAYLPSTSDSVRAQLWDIVDSVMLEYAG